MVVMANTAWLRRNAQRSIHPCKNGVGLPIQVYEDRVMQKRSSNHPVYIDMAQENSGILSINRPFFFNSSARTGWTKQTYGEKSLGHQPFWEVFQKTAFPIAIHTKTRMLFGQHFDGEVPRNLNHVFLRPFEHLSTRNGTFMFKYQNNGANLRCLTKRASNARPWRGLWVVCRTGLT